MLALPAKVPFGFRRGDDGELVSHEAEQEAIPEMIALCAQGKALRAIATAMAAKGHTISHEGVSKVLRANGMRTTTRPNLPDNVMGQARVFRAKLDSGATVDELVAEFKRQPLRRGLRVHGSRRSARQPPPPRPGALGGQCVEPFRQSRKGGDRLLSLRLFGLELGGVLGVARGELGDHPLGLRPLGGEAGGICGIIRNHIVCLFVDPRFSGGELRFQGLNVSL
jgi:hypothetical protein